MSAVTDAAIPTIFEWCGGRAAFRRWLDAFYDLVEADPDLAPLFGGSVSEEHRDHVTTWWAEVMGGPANYTAQHGGYEHMLAKHLGLGITDELRLRFVTLSSAFLYGIISPPKSTVVHAIGEVYLDGRWVRTDTYVTDAELEHNAEKLLLDQGRKLGYGIHLDGARQWDAFNHAYGQSAASDEASLPVQDWGVAHDPEQFYLRAILAV